MKQALTLALAALEANHQHHQDYDDYGGYPDSALCDANEKAIGAVRAALAAEPMFWVRLRSDGGYEGPLHNDAIERVRKDSGAWTPLLISQ